MDPTDAGMRAQRRYRVASYLPEVYLVSSLPRHNHLSQPDKRRVTSEQLQATTPRHHAAKIVDLAKYEDTFCAIEPFNIR
jgi:hypothetical protein